MQLKFLFSVLYFTLLFTDLSFASDNDQPSTDAFVAPFETKGNEIFTIEPYKKLWSKYSDLSPSLSPDGQYLIFQSNREAEQYQLFEVFIYSKTQQSKPIEIILNEFSSFDGSPQLSGRDGLIYYTSIAPENIHEKYSTNIQSDIWVTARFKRSWAKPMRLMSPVNTKYSEITPCLSADRRSLYFSSDRPGGLGGFDIWVSHWKNNKWSEPINMSPTINSTADEVNPRIHVDNESIYFSSNKNGGHGEYDIYVSKRTNKHWSTSFNAGSLVNSKVNDFLNSIPATPDYLLMSRGTKDNEKIYWITPVPEKIKPQNVVSLDITTVEKGTKEPLAFTIEIKQIDTGVVVFQREIKIAHKKSSRILRDMRGNLTYIKSSYFNRAGVTAYLQTGHAYNFYVQSKNHLFIDSNIRLSESESSIIEKRFSLHVLKKENDINIKEIAFIKDSDNIAVDSRDKLYRIARFISTHSQYRVTLSGNLSNTRKVETIAVALRMYGVEKRQVLIVQSSQEQIALKLSLIE